MKTLLIAIYFGALLLICGLAFADEVVDVNSYAYKYRNVNYVYESDGLGSIFGEKNALHRAPEWMPKEGLAYRVTDDSTKSYTLYRLRYTYQKNDDSYSDIDATFTEDGYYKVMLRKTRKF